MKIVNYSITLLIIFVLSGCNGIKPEIMKNHLTVKIPNDNQEKHPVVFFFQSSGGSNTLAHKWAEWFEQYGIVSVLIDNAGVRNLDKLYGVNDTGNDLSPAFEVLKNNPKLDLNHYAVMGFSIGGTASLHSASSLSSKQTKPDFVFSFYPGNSKGCPNSHDEKTRVHVFYGELDDWGTYKNIRNSCKSMTDWNDNATFHLLKNAHHGYDGDWSGNFDCCGNTFAIEPNEKALDKTKEIILKAMKEKWNIKKR